MTVHDIQAVPGLVLVTQDHNLAATTAFLDPFRAANYLVGQGVFQWEVASLNGGSCRASNGLVVETKALDRLAQEKFDVVMVSSSWAPESHYRPQIGAALWRWARHGAMIGGLDTGAFILAQAGLLQGQRATVHYEHVDGFAELFPDVEVSEDLFVFGDRRVTCCGGVAASDVALHLIRALRGDSLANQAARYVFHPGLRQPGSPQGPRVAEPLGGPAPGVVRRAIACFEANLEEPLSIPEVCARIEVSQRQLDRLFARYLRRSPAQYYRDIRLDRARSLVTQTELPLSQVAVASGFASQVHFSRAYKKRFGLPPSTDRIEGRVPFEFRAWPMHSKDYGPKRRLGGKGTMSGDSGSSD